MKIKIKTFGSQLPLISTKKGDWIDLCTNVDVNLKGLRATTLKRKSINGIKDTTREIEFDYTLIPLGIAMELPKGYEALVVPRSSTFKTFGVIMVNSEGIIDNSYCGNNDQWHFPVVAFRETFIPKGARIAQFRIQLSQKATAWQKIKWLFSGNIKFKYVENLSNSDRGGFGSTGTK